MAKYDKPVPTMGAEDSPDAIYDATTLGKPKMIVFGLQHMFAMFGATILVPVLTGLSVSATLLFAGLGTLLFHFLSKGKVPAFLGSSFAFIAGYAAIAPNGEAELLLYACLGVACAGLLYLVLSVLFRGFGALRVMKFFPPVVTGPIVISIGLILSSSAIANASTNWLVAVVAIAVIIVANIWGRGMVKIIPILLGVLVSYLLAVALGEVDFSGVAAAPWVGLPVAFENTVFALSSNFDAGLAITAVITIMPLALATMIEHIGDLVENKVDFMKSRNVLVAALILVLSIGIAYSTAGAIVFAVGGITISLSGLAVGSLAGIVLNAVLPGKDEYSFGGDAPERADEPEMRFPLEGELPKEVKEA